jgi:hypothetical protein
MKLQVLINKKGELVAATDGPIGAPEDMAGHLKGANGQPVAFIVPEPDQTVREVEVPDDLTDVSKTADFHKFVLEAISR